MAGSAKIGHFTLRAALLLVIILLDLAATFQTCPSICTCKWKNGKRWVECRNQDQISIPDQIDMETQVLDLSGNNLQILPREVFARHGLLNLQKLHLSDCKIGQIDPTAFRGLTNLVEINLAGNLLTTIPAATFSDIPYLRSLHLDRNPLQKVEANAFEMIPQLVSLDLSHCNIKRVAARAFAQLTSLEKLFLQHNQISELRQKTVESITGLHAIELANNPWACDCRLRPLKHWLVSNNVPHSTDPTCAMPQRLAGLKFANLQVDEFACPPELLSAPRYVEANVGENATLSCKIGSVPTSKVRWYRDGTEVLNNSLVNRGQQKFVIFERGGFEKTSSLILTNARAEDSGPFMCVSNNQAGRVEANFTLQVGYFVGGVASLESGQIAGIAVTLSAIAVVLLVLLLVFLVRHRQCSSMVLLFSQNQNQKNRQNVNGHLQIQPQDTRQNGQNQSTILSEKATTNGHAIHQNLNGNGSLERLSPTTEAPTLARDGSITNVTNFGGGGTLGPGTTASAQSHLQLQASLAPGPMTASQNVANGNVLINGFPPNSATSAAIHSQQPQPSPQLSHHQQQQSPDLIRGSPITRHSYVNQAVNFSPAHQQYSNTLQPHHRAGQIVRPTPHRLTSGGHIPNGSTLESDQLYPDDYSYQGGGYFNPLTSSPQLSGGTNSPAAFRTLPRGMYQAVNPLKDYGYPSDYGLPMASLASNNSCYITSNPLSEMEMEEEMALGGRQQPHPQVTSNSCNKQMNLSNSSTGSAASTLSPLRGHLSSSGIGGDLSTASGISGTNNYESALSAHPHQQAAHHQLQGVPPGRCSPTGSTPTPTGSSISPGGGSGLYAKVNKKVNNFVQRSNGVAASVGLTALPLTKRESPDEGIQDDVSTDV